MDKTKTKISIIKKLEKFTYKERIELLKDLITMYKTEKYFGILK